MNVWSVPTSDGGWLAFRGTQLARASSAGCRRRGGSRRRWAELRLFLRDDGQYVLAGSGRSTEPLEDDRHWAVVTHDPRVVVERLTLRDRSDRGRRYLPSVAVRLLREAGEDFERFFGQGVYDGPGTRL